MPCEQPHTAYQGLHGGPISFTRPKKGNVGIDYVTHAIPCGTCLLCRDDQARQWAIRIYHEAQKHERNSFLTLTYNDKHLPAYGTLDYEHLVLFWKKLRKHYGKMRYYAVGEYGDETRRAHYHACIFGHDFTQNAEILRTTPTRLWTNPELQEIWGKGQVAVGNLDFGTARYTASYVTKKLRSKQQYVRIDENTGELIPLEQPRGFMSKNIGRAWWEEYRHQVSAHDYVVINGKRHKPPRAYDRWLKERSEIALGMLQDKREEGGKRLTKEKTRARARSAHVRAQRKSKKL